MLGRSRRGSAARISSWGAPSWDAPISEGVELLGRLHLSGSTREEAEMGGLGWKPHTGIRQVDVPPHGQVGGTQPGCKRRDSQQTYSSRGGEGGRGEMTFHQVNAPGHANEPGRRTAAATGLLPSMSAHCHITPPSVLPHLLSSMCPPPPSPLRWSSPIAVPSASPRKGWEGEGGRGGAFNQGLVALEDELHLRGVDVGTGVGR